jgi:hypothetical protein
VQKAALAAPIRIMNKPIQTTSNPQTKTLKPMKTNIENPFNSIGLLLILTLLNLSTLQVYSQDCVSCDSTITSGLFPSAIGKHTKATANYSFAGGIYSEANGSASFAFGNRAFAEGGSSAVLGQFARVNTSTAMVFGAGFDIDNPLINSETHSLMIGFGSTKPTFFVGESIGINNTGKVGIGNVTDPQAKLHIRADEGEDATLRLEATSANKHARIYFDDDLHITGTPQQNLSFSLPENKGVGIGTSTPEATLHVNGDFQVGTAANPQEISLHGSINAIGEYATAFGEGNTASGNYSFVAGRNSHIISTPQFASHYSNIIGSWSSIEKGPHSNVIGSFSQALNDFSFVFGTYAKAKGSYSFAIGSHVEALSGGSFVFGAGRIDAKLTNNHHESLMIGFNSPFPTIFVSRTPVGSESGSVGIGNITDPQAKLHIRADEGEDASLKLEATGTQQQSRVYFTDEHQIRASQNDAMHLHSSQGKGFVFHDGDIYLHDIQSGIIMKSPNGQCWRGRLSDNGNLGFEQTDCPEEATAAVGQLPKQDRLRLYPNPTGSSITIETDLHGLYAEVLISTLDGKPVSRQRIQSNRMEISLDHFVAGSYLLSLELNGQVVETHKVIKH